MMKVNYSSARPLLFWNILLLSACNSLTSNVVKPTLPSGPNDSSQVVKQLITDKVDFFNLGPKMALIPAGEFVMGSHPSEPGRDLNEGPQHKVNFLSAFYLSLTHITVEQFRYFVEDADYLTTAESERGSMIRFPNDDFWTQSREVNWRHDNRGDLAPDDFPVVNIAWEDAQAYTIWLSKQTGKPYRLATEAEIEYSNRAGSTTNFWWGDDTPPNLTANIKGQLDLNTSEKTWYPTLNERIFAYEQGYTPMFFANYGDGFSGLAPAGSFPPNPFGLHDTAGNVWTWTQDCYHPNYNNAPTDGSAWLADGDCYFRIVRGGSYYCFPRQIRSANRWSVPHHVSMMYIGFRVARDL